MHNHKPRVSIGLPVYNGARFLTETLDAILMQTFADFELVISDNASTDGTRAICEAYAAKDSRIRYYRSEYNQGAGWNFNRVFELSSGEYFKWAAHDDLLAPTFLEKCVAVLDCDPSVVVCYSWTHLIDESGNELGHYEFNGLYKADSSNPYERFRDIVIPYHWCFQIFGLIRADALKKTPGMGSYLSADRVLLAWLSLLGRFYEIPDYLFISKRYPQQSGTMMQRPLAYMTWYNPKNRERLTLPNWQEYLEYFKAANGVPLSVYNRIRCSICLLDLTKHGKRARYLVKDLVITSALFISRIVIKRAALRSAY